jgi:hypothetical protein
MDRTEYFAQPQVAQVLQELEDACFAVRDDGEGEDAFPDAMDFLRERGVDPPGGGSIQVRHTVEESPMSREELENKPNKPRCPEGGDCFPGKCKWIGGEYVCSWVCNCP